MDANTSALIGIWELCSYVSTDEAGHTTYPLGSNPRGLGIYTADGTMSAQLMRTSASTNSEDTDSSRNYIAYCGSYQVNVDHHEVLHLVECSIDRDWIGTVLRRNFTLNDDELTLEPPLSTTGSQSTLTWRRRA